MRVLGPNCLGLISPHHGLNATFAKTDAIPGNIAFISQSGALCTAVLDWSLRERVGFSGFVSTGACMDVGWADLITHFGDDPRTESIICYMESVGDAGAFLHAAKEVAPRKPIVVLKVGRSDAGAKAAASHTGAMTGSDAVLEIAFRRAGVLRVRTVNEMFNMAELLAKQPRPRGPRLAVVTNAGGPGALTADALVANSGVLATLSAETLHALDAVLPAAWSHGNPVDILGDADAERFATTLSIIANDDGADAVCVILTPQTMTDPAAIARELVAARPLFTGKPLLACWMGGDAVEQGRAILNEAGISTFAFPDMAARAFGLMWRESEIVRALDETPPPAISTGKTMPRNGAAEEIIREALESGRTLLNEVEAKQLLVAHGIPVVETLVAHTEAEAVSIAERIGFPVVVKLLSNTITHKTEVRGVHLDLRDAAAVRAAWKAIRANVATSDFQGVSAQRMIARDGVEIILGSSTDAQFGPVILFGAGGTNVEVFKDHAIDLPPLDAALARRLMRRTRIHTALEGVRGKPPVDMSALEDAVMNFSRLVIAHPEIKEIDINPLLASPAGVVALDARVLLWRAAAQRGTS